LTDINTNARVFSWLFLYKINKKEVSLMEESMSKKLFSAMRVYTTLSIKPDWREFYDDKQKILKLFASLW